MLAGTGPGGPPTFFASPKKVSQERRPRFIRPSGTQKSTGQNGKGNKLACGSDRFRFLIRFGPCSFGGCTGAFQTHPTLTLPLKGRGPRRLARLRVALPAL